MEPTDLNSRHDEQLEAWLRQSVRAPIADDGFTARVLNQLPPPQRAAASAWSRPLAPILGAIAGGIVVWSRGLDLSHVQVDLERLAQSFAQPQVAIAAIALLGAFVGVYAPDLRRRWFGGLL